MSVNVLHSLWSNKNQLFNCLLCCQMPTLHYRNTCITAYTSCSHLLWEGWGGCRWVLPSNKRSEQLILSLNNKDRNSDVSSFESFWAGDAARSKWINHAGYEAITLASVCPTARCQSVNNVVVPMRDAVESGHIIHPKVWSPFDTEFIDSITHSAAAPAIQM